MGLDIGGLLSPEQAQQHADQVDVVRHILGQTIVPRSVGEFDQIWRDARRVGAITPSGKAHADVGVDVREALELLEDQGLVHRISGQKDFDAIARKARTLDSTVDDPHGTPETENLSRSEVWALQSSDPEHRDAFDPADDHWVMTKKGFRHLTGHDQGEDVAIRAQNEQDEADREVVEGDA